MHYAGYKHSFKYFTSKLSVEAQNLRASDDYYSHVSPLTIPNDIIYALLPYYK